MERKEFLKLMGLSTAGIWAASCLGGCSKDSVPAAPSNVNITLKLADYPSLATNGNFIQTNGLLVGKTMSGNYIAVSAACTHEGATVGYDTSSTQFVCPRHGAKFSETGAVISGPTSTALKQYTVQYNATAGTLTITG